MSKREINAFTLAEVLITLMIIGIVASLTIPSLITNINNAEIPIKVKKSQTTLSDAVRMLMSKNGVGSLEGLYADNNAFWNDFKPYLNVVKDCGVEIGQGCFPSGVTYKYINGANSDIRDDSNNIKVVLGDGSILAISGWSANCDASYSISGSGVLTTKCISIGIDVNGHSGPNQIGRDYFSWRIYRNGQTIPQGTDDDKAKGCDPLSVDLTAGMDGAPGYGLGCTAKVLQEGAINY